MPARSDSFKERLARVSEIKITVTGRKSGRPVSIPVWFVLEGESFIFCRCRAPTHSGIRMCSKIRKYALTHAAQKLSLR